jgi:DNA invertase Pin-like site-specific DNA recombinase
VVGLFKETASGVRLDRVERRKVMALAQARRIDAVVVTELTRWGRSTLDLLQTLRSLQAWKVSVIAQTGLQFDLQFDLGTSQGRMLASMMAALAEFERDLLCERIRSGMAAAKARGRKLGRQPGQRPKSDRLSPMVLAMIGDGLSYRTIAKRLGISKNTVVDIVKRHRRP